MTLGRDRLQLPMALVLVIAATGYWFAADFFGQEVLAEIAIFAIFAMSLDILVGYAGMVSLGHAAFLAAGAYTTAACTVFLQWPVWFAMVASIASAAAMAALVGALVVRLTGVFFIMVTLAVGQMVYAYLLKNRAFGADDGMAGIPRLDLSFAALDTNDPATFAAITLVCVFLVYLALRVVVRSPFGAILIAIHQNENRARALGCPVRLYKLAAFVLAGAVAGLAGSLTAQHTSFVSPDLAFWTLSGEILIVVIVGGRGSLLGAIAGAAIIILMRHTLSELTEFWVFWMGCFFVLVVLVAADGLYGTVARALSRISHKKPVSESRQR